MRSVFWICELSDQYKTACFLLLIFWMQTEDVLEGMFFRGLMMEENVMLVSWHMWTDTLTLGVVAAVWWRRGVFHTWMVFILGAGGVFWWLLSLNTVTLLHIYWQQQEQTHTRTHTHFTLHCVQLSELRCCLSGVPICQCPHVYVPLCV